MHALKGHTNDSTRSQQRWSAPLNVMKVFNAVQMLPANIWSALACCWRKFSRRLTLLYPLLRSNIGQRRGHGSL